MKIRPSITKLELKITKPLKKIGTEFFFDPSCTSDDSELKNG